MSLFNQKMSRIRKNKAEGEHNRSMCSLGKISWQNNQLSSYNSFYGSKMMISPIDKEYCKDRNSNKEKEKDKDRHEEDNALIASLITYYNNRIGQLMLQNKKTPKADVKDILIEQERIISSLYEEIAKLHATEEMNRNKIAKLNKNVSDMKSNMENLKSHNTSLSKENASMYKSNINNMLQQQKETYVANEEKDCHYYHKYNELKKMIEIERSAYREQLSELVKARGKLLEENCQQAYQFKKEKDQMKATLKTVLSDSSSLKSNCEKMKQECLEINKFQAKTIKAIMSKLTSYTNIPKKPINGNDNDKKLLNEYSTLTKQLQREKAVLIEKKVQLSNEVEKLMNRIIILENENEALSNERHVFILKNNELDDQTEMLREYYENILEEKNTKINEVHSAINNSIFSLSNGMTNITKANMLDKQVKEMLKKITPDFSFSQSIQPHEDDD